jgi:hypothetical protein
MDSKSLKDVVLSHASHSEVVFEDYLFYATLQRKEEESQEVNSETSKVIDDPKGLPTLSLDEQERMEATRALRIASWISIFFLLTTDVGGPVTAPYAISQVGWIPGVILSIIRCVYSLVVALPLIHHPVSSWHTIVVLGGSTMGTVRSTRFSQVPAKNVRRCGGTGLREICATCLQSSAGNAITYHCIFFHRNNVRNNDLSPAGWWHLLNTWTRLVADRSRTSEYRYYHDNDELRPEPISCVFQFALSSL